MLATTTSSQQQQQQQQQRHWQRRQRAPEGPARMGGHPPESALRLQLERSPRRPRSVGRIGRGGDAAPRKQATRRRLCTRTSRTIVRSTTVNITIVIITIVSSLRRSRSTVSSISEASRPTASTRSSSSTARRPGGADCQGRPRGPHTQHREGFHRDHRRRSGLFRPESACRPLRITDVQLRGADREWDCRGHRHWRLERCRPTSSASSRFGNRGPRGQEEQRSQLQPQVRRDCRLRIRPGDGHQLRGRFRRGHRLQGRWSPRSSTR